MSACMPKSTGMSACMSGSLKATNVIRGMGDYSRFRMESGTSGSVTMTRYLKKLEAMYDLEDVVVFEEKKNILRVLMITADLWPKYSEAFSNPTVNTWTKLVIALTAVSEMEQTPDDVHVNSLYGSLHSMNKDENLLDSSSITSRLTGRSFVTTVLTIIGTQLLTTSVIITILYFLVKRGGPVVIHLGSRSLNVTAPFAVLYNQVTIWTTFGFFMTMVGSVACCSNNHILRMVPLNYLFLVLFTWFESHMLSAVTILLDLPILFITVTIMGSVLLLVAAAVRYAPRRFIKMYAWLSSVILIWIVVWLLYAFKVTTLASTTYAAFAMTLFIMYIAMNMKMVAGSNREFEEDNYMYAAINVYLNVWNIFMYLPVLLEDGM